LRRAYRGGQRRGRYSLIRLSSGLSHCLETTASKEWGPAFISPWLAEWAEEKSSGKGLGAKGKRRGSLASHLLRARTTGGPIFSVKEKPSHQGRGGEKKHPHMLKKASKNRTFRSYHYRLSLCPSRSLLGEDCFHSSPPPRPQRSNPSVPSVPLPKKRKEKIREKIKREACFSAEFFPRAGEGGRVRAQHVVGCLGGKKGVFIVEPGIYRRASGSADQKGIIRK